MNPFLRQAIHAIFNAPEDDKGGGGGGGEGDKAGGDKSADQGGGVKAADARTYLTEWVDPDLLKDMPEDKVLGLHKRVTTQADKAIKAAAAKAEADAKAVGEKWTKGELKLELPKDSKLGQSDVDEIAAIAAKRGLSSEQATELLQQCEAAAASFETRSMEKLKTQRNEWIAAVKADPEIGGEKLAETQRLSMLTIEKFMPQEMREMLRTTGFGDHPVFVKFLVNIGRSMAEDRPGGGGGAGDGGKKSAEDVLYGKPST